MNTNRNLDTNSNLDTNWIKIYIQTAIWIMDLNLDNNELP